ncbi:hypothetical protein KGF54_003892 [Candida jiufengensis]|uniref:uncharacterized protein n=1 Tax=Candida jiufengensis TaxID=497108 RepID=UPI002225AF0B|nr:uncharacterized protein KGF54_003892 [Candida jiufengensis]KAI5950818.1 hypothetical protein KGF54_003892 [Candida jiufengensis]
MNDSGHRMNGKSYTNINSPTHYQNQNSYAHTTTAIYDDLNPDSFSPTILFDDINGEDILKTNPNYKANHSSVVDPTYPSSHLNGFLNNKENEYPQDRQFFKNNQQNLKSKSSISEPKQIHFNSIPQLGHISNFHSPIHQSTPNPKQTFKSNKPVNMGQHPFNDSINTTNDDEYITIRKSDYLRSLDQYQRYKQQPQLKESLNSQFNLQLEELQNQIDQLKITDLNLSNKVDQNRAKNDNCFKDHELKLISRNEHAQNQINIIKLKINQLSQFINEYNINGDVNGEVSMLRIDDKEVEESLIELNPLCEINRHSASAHTSSSKTTSQQIRSNDHQSSSKNSNPNDSTSAQNLSPTSVTNDNSNSKNSQNKSDNKQNTNNLADTNNVVRPVSKGSDINCASSVTNSDTHSNAQTVNSNKVCTCGASSSNTSRTTKGSESSNNDYVTCSTNLRHSSDHNTRTSGSANGVVNEETQNVNNNDNNNNNNTEINATMNTSEETTISEETRNVNNVVSQQQQQNLYPEFDHLKYHYPMPGMIKNEQNLNRIDTLSRKDLQFIAKHLVSSMQISIDDLFMEVTRIGIYITKSSQFIKNLHLLLKDSKVSIGKFLKGEIMNDSGKIDNDLVELEKCFDTMFSDVNTLIKLKKFLMEKQGQKIRI